MLRDKIMLNNSVFLLSTECRGCGLKDHLIENCERIHLVINRNVKIRQFLHFKPINEREYFLRKRKKINSLKILRKCEIMISEFQESLSDEKELDAQTFERLSIVEIETNSKKEIPTNETYDIKTEFILGNIKKTPNFSAQQNDANESILTSKLSNKKEKSDINLDKLHIFKYYYPDFNFENVNNRLTLARERKTGISNDKKKKRTIKLN